MDFLQKLNFLMDKNNLNKSTLSKACDIPYTTIDGWYKKGYEGLKLTSLRKLSHFFCTSLDYWAESNESQEELTLFEQQHIEQYRQLNSDGQTKVKEYVDDLVQSGKYGRG